MVEAGLFSRLGVAAAVLAAGVLSACTLPPPPPEPVAASVPAPAVARPGPGKTPAAFQRDDAACRAEVAALYPAQPTAEQYAAARSGVVLATEAGAGPVGTSSNPPPPGGLSPDATYARCMTSRQNRVP